MNKILFLVSMLSTSIISSPVFGSEMQNEIDHLLTFVENMECQYERNEDMHSGKDAAKHIKRNMIILRMKLTAQKNLLN